MKENKGFVLDPHEEKRLKLVCSQKTSVVYKTPESVEDRDLIIQIWTRRTNEHLEVLQLEILNEKDIFFHYSFRVDEEGYDEYKEDKELRVGFKDFYKTTLEYLKDAHDKMDMGRAELRFDEEGEATLVFTKRMKMKFSDVLVFDMKIPPRDITRRCIQSRYNTMWKKLDTAESDFINTRLNVMDRSPSLAKRLDDMMREERKKKKN